MEVREYRDARGATPVSDYIERLRASGERSAPASFEFLVDLLTVLGPPLGMPRDRRIDRASRMYELRPGDHRVAYVWRGEVVWLLHAWRKQTAKLDARALRTALRPLEELSLE